jgi:hypothetical protein
MLVMVNNLHCGKGQFFILQYNFIFYIAVQCIERLIENIQWGQPIRVFRNITTNLCFAPHK